MNGPKFHKTSKEVYDFIAAFTNEKGYAPAIMEIARGIGKSKLTAQNHVEALNRDGFIEQLIVNHRAVPRTMRIVRPFDLPTEETTE